jgi:TolA-binding protein
MHTLFKSRITAVFLAAFSFAPLQAHAGLFDDDEARKAILEIRSKMDTLSRDIGTRLDSKSDKTSAIDLLNQNEQLRQEIAKLRGKVEVLTNELANTQQRQKDFYVDLDNRLRALEPQKVTVDGKETTVEQEELKIYNTALAQFKGGEYRDAGALFFDFLLLVCI